MNSETSMIQTFSACTTSMLLLKCFRNERKKNRRRKLASAFNSQVKWFSHVEFQPIAFVGLNVYLFYVAVNLN